MLGNEIMAAEGRHLQEIAEAEAGETEMTTTGARLAEPPEEPHADEAADAARLR